jgi:DNA polymerase I
MSERLVLIDGHALVYRAFHALPTLTSPKGELVNAVFGFVQMLLKACTDLRPDYLVATFDTSSRTFRRAEFAEYKATRAPTPEGLPHQVDLVQRLLDSLRVPIYRLEGYEADDLLGTLSCQAAQQGLDTIILTGDTDALQLVGPCVRVLTSRRGFTDTVLYGEEEVQQRYGLVPRQLTDLRGLRGDSSDNIPGVPGIGDKTAAKLLDRFGTVEQLYQHLEELPARQRDQLAPYAEQVARSKRLATIVCDLDVQLDLARARMNGLDLGGGVEVLRTLGFSSLVDRLPKVLAAATAAPVSAAGGQLGLFDGGAAATATAAASVDAVASAVAEVALPAVVSEPADVDGLAAALQEAGSLTLAVQGSIRDAMRADLCGLALGGPGVATSYVPLDHSQGPRYAPPPDAPLGPLGALLASDLPKLAHNAKSQSVLLARQGVELRGVEFDTMLAAYLLEPGARTFELRDVAWSKLQEEVPPLADLIGTGKSALTLGEVEVDRCAVHAVREADLVARLTPILRRELAEASLDKLYAELELPLVPVLAAMELAGVSIDVPYLQELSRELHIRLQEIEGEAFAAVGHQFNLNSPKQLSEVLFDELGLPRARKTSTGQGSTGADVLESLRAAHPVVELILEHRQLHKLKTTYVDALPLLVNPRTGRVHTSFNQTIAATGRLSSSEPNLKNIPVRTELGRRVRHAFVPGQAGCRLLSADYSQIELRVLAHETGDPRLLEAFLEGQDIHAATAAEVMGVQPSEVTPDMRRFAKVVNFGVLYGMSEFGLASRADLPAAEAASFISRYFERFGTVKAYQDWIIREAERKGYVETLLGRRRYMPELKSRIHNVRQGAIRAAVNHPIQGAASDIMKIAMIRVHDFIRERGLKTRLILQVHDELVFETPEDELMSFKDDLRRIMMGAMELKVPLDVELKAGPNWDSLVPLDHA